MKAYCAMSKKMDEVGDDEKKAEAAGDEIDGYFKTLGEDFENAWDSGQDAKDGSPKRPRWMKPSRRSTPSANNLTIAIRLATRGLGNLSPIKFRTEATHRAARQLAVAVRSAFDVTTRSTAPTQVVGSPPAACTKRRSPVYSRHLTRETYAPCG